MITTTNTGSVYFRLSAYSIATAEPAITPIAATSTAAKPAASVPRMVPARRLAPWKVVDMWVILLEAGVALALLGGICLLYTSDAADD